MNQNVAVDRVRDDEAEAARRVEPFDPSTESESRVGVRFLDRPRHSPARDASLVDLNAGTHDGATISRSLVSLNRHSAENQRASPSASGSISAPGGKASTARA